MHFHYIINHIADGNNRKIPLIGGEQLSSLVHNYAKSVNAKAGLCGMLNYDDAVVIWLGTDISRLLDSITFNMTTYDNELAVIGLNIIRGRLTATLLQSVLKFKETS